MLRRILLLLGETPSSISARQYALRLAQGTKAEVAGLTGIDLPYLETPMPGRVGASAYATRLHKTLKEQADALAQRLRERFQAECQAGGIASESLTFEGDPIAELCSSAETHDLIVTGHDTAFRGNIHESLSEILSKLLLITPRPMIVCPDGLSNATSILIAYDGSLPAMRALQMFALFGIGLDRVVQVMSIDASRELVSQRIGRAAKYLRFHGYQVDEAPVASRLRPAEVLKSEIANRKIRTAVMGAYGHRGLRERLFGSTTGNLAENPPCALFLYH